MDNPSSETTNSKKHIIVGFITIVISVAIIILGAIAITNFSRTWLNNTVDNLNDKQDSNIVNTDGPIKYITIAGNRIDTVANVETLINQLEKFATNISINTTTFPGIGEVFFKYNNIQYMVLFDFDRDERIESAEIKSISILVHDTDAEISDGNIVYHTENENLILGVSTKYDIMRVFYSFSFFEVSDGLVFRFHRANLDTYHISFTENILTMITINYQNYLLGQPVR